MGEKVFLELEGTAPGFLSWKELHTGHVDWVRWDPGSKTAAENKVTEIAQIASTRSYDNMEYGTYQGSSPSCKTAVVVSIYPNGMECGTFCMIVP
jgi:hypothetical protein